MDRYAPPLAGSGISDRVAIVGGGAAGTLIALQLAERGIATTVFDRREAFGRGVAYSATAAWHRLNVPIEKMGGWGADEHDQTFRDWFVATRGPLSERHADRYVARSVYGAWLRSELDRVAALGLSDLCAGEVVSAVPEGDVVHLGLADGRTTSVPAAVLCPGNQPPRPLPVPIPAGYVPDIWAPGAMQAIAAAEPVLIVGTGATGIDALLDLHHRGHRGPIHMLSRRGILPLEDAPPAPYTLQRTIVADRPRLRDVVRLLREEVDEATAAGHAWQSVVDAFRAHIPRLWAGLSDTERGRFLRHLRGHWLVHRHRLAPDIAALLRRLQSEERVSILSGRLRAARAQDDRIAIDIERRHGGALSLTVGWVINCTGPEEDFRRGGDRLATHLLASGTARPGTFGVGLDVDGIGRLCRSDGTIHTRMFVLGGATRTHFGEVTSAPQIRRRASHLTEAIARVLRGSPADR
jgi:uncharacterized NAD(P)/FAD-binding protein YdhS